MAREVELKLEMPAASLNRLRDGHALGASAGIVSASQPESRLLSSTYFDTDEACLQKAGMTLRLRDVEGAIVQTLKGPDTSAGPLKDRFENEVTLPSKTASPDINHLPKGLNKQLRQVTAHRTLTAQFKTDIRRTHYLLRTAQGAVIEVAIDEGTIVTCGQGSATGDPVAEVELELKSGPRAGLYRLALAMAKQVPLKIGGKSKAARGYRLCQLAQAAQATKPAQPADKPQAFKPRPLKLKHRQTGDRAFEKMFLDVTAHLEGNIAALIEHQEADALHQVRVSLRRLRTLFSLVGADKNAALQNQLRADARWLGGELGHARDLDVFCSSILPPVERAFPGERGLAVLRARAQSARRQAWKRALSAVATARFATFRLALALYIEEESWRPADKPITGKISDVAPGLLDARLKAVCKLGRHIEELDIAQRHELRKRLKRLRYTAGFFAGLYGKKTTAPYLQRLAGLQDIFGELNDVTSAKALVPELVAQLTKEDVATHLGLAQAAGLLVGWHEGRADAAWKGAQKVWRRFDKLPLFWR